MHQQLLSWYDTHGRKDLPWQNPRHVYRVWISEIMLQQTQVQTVIPYFNRFIAQFPTVTDLAQAPEDAVLALWSGLGYYSRARNLHKTAKIIVEQYAGIIPDDINDLINLPGIGASTAAAITSQAYGQSTPILDANVKRVLARYFKVDGIPDNNAVKNKLWTLAGQCMPLQRAADYTQAIMDLGALLCKPRNPQCSLCPLQHDCLAFKDRVTDRYPEKKIKKPIPTERQQFLLFYNQKNEIYLEKRPPSGIWGGLWCLPSIALDVCPRIFIAENFDLDIKNINKLPSFKHTFSHFHLEIYPLAIYTHPKSTMHIRDSQGIWYEKSGLSAIGLAKPISKILSSWLLNSQP